MKMSVSRAFLRKRTPKSGLDIGSTSLFARKAQVSYATVSLVVSGKSTSKHIEKIIMGELALLSSRPSLLFDQVQSSFGYRHIRRLH